MKRLAALLVFIISVNLIAAQPTNPFIKNYKSADLENDISPESYCVGQDSNGKIFAGTANGILSFNGVDWSFLPIKKGVFVMSLAIGVDDKIFVGSTNEFGYFEKNELNQYNYISISDSLNDELIGVIWKVYTIRGVTYFQSEHAIYVYENDEIKTIKSNSSYHLSFALNDKIIARERGIGLVEINNKKINILKNSEIFAEIGVFGIEEGDDSKIIFTQEKGVFELSDSIAITILENDKIYSSSKIYGAIKLNDGNYALNSLENGVLILSDNRIITNYNKKNGLASNDVKGICEDKFGNIWCATGQGISVINYNSPFSYYGDKSGLSGDIEVIIEDGLIGGSEGLFKRKENYYQKLDFHAQVWDIENVKDQVYIASSDGLFVMKENNFELVSEGTFNTLNFVGNYLICTGTFGIKVLTTSNKAVKWYELPLNRTYGTLYDSINNELWIGTIGQGILKITLSDFTLTIYGAADGLDVAWVKPLHLNDSILIVGTASGEMEFVSEKEVQKSLTDSLKNNPDFYRGYFNYLPERNITTAELDDYSISKNIFIDRKNNITYSELDFGRLNFLYQCENAKVLIGSSEGLIEFIPEGNQKSYSFDAFIDKLIISNDSLVSDKSKIDYSYNDLKFEISAPFYEGNHSVQFSHILIGQDTEWSEWTNSNLIKYTNLYEGDYELRVKARNIFNQETKESIVSFTINAPWYRTFWAFILYLVFLIFIIWIAIKIASMRLKKKNEELERIVVSRTKKIAHQKDIIEEKHLEIRQSINYAERIQKAMMANEEHWQRIGITNFIYFQPKDVVSGDFYWAFDNEHYSVWTAADCTGHGVPGAFMSMLSIGFLNEIVIEGNEFYPAEILNKLRKKIINSLEQKSSDDERKDGLDISLCVLDKKKEKIYFSGANNPLYIVRDINKFNPEEYESVKTLELEDKILIEFKADPMPVGKYLSDNKPFNQIEINLVEGDTYYSFSDGMVDQFGGPKNKKYMSKRFKLDLLGMQNLSLEEQKNNLKTLLNDWIEDGKDEQIDDVCIVSVKF